MTLKAITHADVSKALRTTDKGLLKIIAFGLAPMPTTEGHINAALIAKMHIDRSRLQGLKGEQLREERLLEIREENFHLQCKCPLIPQVILRYVFHVASCLKEIDRLEAVIEELKA